MSLLLGVIVGFIALLFIEFIPILGPILAGRGVGAGFLSGIIALLIASTFLTGLGLKFRGAIGEH